MVRCMLKPGGLFFLGFPSNSAYDEVVWNAHRVYGPYRLPLASSGFEVLDFVHERNALVFSSEFAPRTSDIPMSKAERVRGQPLFVLRKPQGQRRGHTSS